MLSKKAMMASSAVEPLWVDSVFSTYLYTGNGSTQTITNGIDLAGEGGLVWQKIRSSTGSHILVDTARGAGNFLNSNSTSAQTFNASVVSSFNSDGFTDGGSQINGATYASWTFRKAPKFFDVVTYTGTGSARTVAHSLDSVPGMIIVKRTDTTGDWQVYHRANTANPETDYLVLNSTAATADSDTRWNDTLPTASVFSLGTDATVNASGGTYVAYLFAHDAGGFGESGTDNIVSCGPFAAGTGEVTLGYEPQWIMFKSTSGTGGWIMFDTMRGWVNSPDIGGTLLLQADTSGAEGATGLTTFQPTATGFKYNLTADYIYLAIRRPNKPPTIGTEVFSPVAQNAATNAVVTTSFPVDLSISAQRDRTSFPFTLFIDRLRGSTLASTTALLASQSTNAEQNFGTASGIGFDSNVSIIDNLWAGTYGASSSISYLSFRRAPGFFDVVCYTGTGSSQNVPHNLGVAPQLIITKSRSVTGDWNTYAEPLGNGLQVRLEVPFAAVGTSMWGYTNPTATQFTIGSGNTSGVTFVAYLFASAPGVSKVGGYTGTGTTLQINCGFTTGARFVLIKRTDSDTGDWYVWDTARGIIAGNDPYLLLNSTAAEVTNTDYIDPLASGFEISSTAPAAINASGGNFIFLAVA
jgi:hypothetical protein